MAVDEAKLHNLPAGSWPIWGSPGSAGRAGPVQPRLPGATVMTASAQASRKPARRPAPGVLALPGARLAYEVTGTGPAVVLVHGFGLDMRMWDPQAGASGGTVPGGAVRLPRVRRLRAVRPSRPLHPRRRPASRCWTISVSGRRCWPGCRSAAGS